jgi:hypothetical protein
MTKFIIVILLIVLVQIESKAQFSIGAGGGYNRSTYTGDTPPNEIYGWSGGATFAISTTYDLSPIVALNLNVNMHNNNALYQTYDDESDPEIKTDSAKLKFSAFAIPLCVIVKSKNNRFFVKSGFEVQLPYYAKAIRTDSKVDFLSQIKDVTLAVKFGAGYYIPIGKPRLLLGIDYVQGISNIANDNFDYELDYRLVRTKIRGIRFAVGIEFPLGENKN